MSTITFPNNLKVSSSNWKSVCYGNNRFVAVNDNNNIVVINDNQITPILIDGASPDIGWVSICYGNNQFFAAGVDYNTGGSVTAFLDKNMTQVPNYRTLDGAITPVSVCYGNGMFAVLSEGQVQFLNQNNRDIIDSVSLNDSTLWRSIAYGNGKLVAVGYGEISIIDPKLFNVSNQILLQCEWESVCYGNGMFVAVGSNGNSRGIIATLPDGAQNFTVMNDIPDNVMDFFSVCYGPGMFVLSAYARDGYKLFTLNNTGTLTPAGIIPSYDTNSLFTYSLYSMSYGNNRLFIVGMDNRDHGVILISDAVTDETNPLLSDDTTMCNFGIIFCIILILRISTKTNVVLLLLIALLLSFVFKDYCLF